MQQRKLTSPSWICAHPPISSYQRLLRALYWPISILDLSISPQPIDRAPIFDRNIVEGGKSCEEALDFFGVSSRLPTTEGRYTHRIDGRFGSSNDYNPYEPSGLLPGCSLVYDAIGHEVVYRIDLEPGDELSLRLTLPQDTAGGLYFLDSCGRGT